MHIHGVPKQASKSNVLKHNQKGHFWGFLHICPN